MRFFIGKMICVLIGLLLVNWPSLGKSPTREVALIVTPEGYYPQFLSVFAGERVRFFITSITEKKSCFILSEKKLFMAAEKGLLSEGEAHFKNPGRYSFHCPTGKIKGRLQVLPRKNKKKDSSKEKKKIADWRPREDDA